MSKVLTFEQQAEIAAFQAFMYTMRKYKLYFPILKIINDFTLKQNNSKRGEVEMVNGLVPLNLIIGSMNWDAVHEALLRAIHENISNMGGQFKGTNAQYDFLIHCVNTMLQRFVEFGILKKGIKIKNSMPKLDVLGQEIFNLAAKKVFGQDFVDESPVNHEQNCIPRTQEEAKIAARLFNHYMQEGFSPQQAATEVAKALAAHRANNVRNEEMNPWDELESWDSETFDENENNHEENEDEDSWEWDDVFN